MQIINTIAIALATLVTISHGHRGHGHRFTHHRMLPRYVNNGTDWPSSTSSVVDAALTSSSPTSEVSSATSLMESTSIVVSSSMTYDNSAASSMSTSSMTTSSTFNILSTGIADAATTGSSATSLMLPSYSPVSLSSSLVSAEIGSSASSTSDSAFNYSPSRSSPSIMSSPSVTSVLAVDTSTMTSTTSTSISTYVSAATLTFTQGTGSSATVITTTIHMTKTFTVTDTIYMHKSTAAVGNSVAPAVVSAAPANFAAGASVLPITSATPANLAAESHTANEPTTTLTATSTSTTTVTVDVATTNGANEAAVTNVAGVGGGDMGGACSIVTVTTVLQSTIWVTATPQPPSTAAAPLISSQSAVVAVADIQSSISAILAHVSSITQPGSSSTTSSMASALPSSFFGQGNSTEAANSTKHKLVGTGFVTLSSGSAMSTGW